MASTEEDFPRGGKAKQTTESKTEPVRRHTEVDNLFEVKKKTSLVNHQCDIRTLLWFSSS